MNRLPYEVKFIINRTVGDAERHIDEPMTIIEKEISARERAFNSNDLRGPQMQTTAALLVSDGQPKCTHCRQSQLCTVVTDINQRITILKRAGRCFVYLKRHHLSWDYRSAAKCTHCGGHHHTSICKNSHAGSHGSRTQQRSETQNDVAATRQTLSPTQLPATPQLLHPPALQSSSRTLQQPSSPQLRPSSHHVAEQLLTPTTQLFMWKCKYLSYCRQQRLVCLTWMSQNVRLL